MRTFGIVSYNIYCNFTNYGSALQSWALSQVIQRLGYNAKLIDYCPEVLKEADPLNPFKLIWNKDEESRRMWELPMPAIRETYAQVRQLKHDVLALHNEKNKVKQKSLMTRFGEALVNVVMPDAEASETESSIELNFMVAKFKHTVRKTRLAAKGENAPSTVDLLS